MAKFINAASIAFQVDERTKYNRPEAIKQFREAEERLDGTGLDLLVTCEGMSSLGQSMEEAESLENPGEILSLYRNFAMRNQCTVAGSLKLKHEEQIFNALVYALPDGTFAESYKKVYLTSGEVKKGLSPGAHAKTVATPAGKVGGVICFDINFDSLRDEYMQQHPDILCFASMCNGGHILQNWAYKTRSFLVSAVKDGLSMIIDPLGRIVNSTTYYNRTTWARLNLDRFVMHCDHNIDRFPDIRRKYKNDVLIDVDQTLCSAVLYSNCEKPAQSIAEEFGLIQIDDFLNKEK